MLSAHFLRTKFSKTTNTLVYEIKQVMEGLYPRYFTAINFNPRYIAKYLLEEGKSVALSLTYPCLL